MIDKKDQNNKFELKTNSLIEDAMIARKNAIASGDANMSKGGPSENDHVGTMIYSFGKLIRYNTRI